MGRIKTIFIKRIGREIFEKNPEKFTTDYSENKQMLREYVDIRSKKIENIVAGYVTTLKTQKSR